MKIMSFRRIVTFGLGVAVGYYLGNREGREQARAAVEQAKSSAQQFWTDPKTQEQVHKATGMAAEALKDKVPKLGTVTDKAADLIDKSTGYDGSAQDQTDAAQDKAGHETVQANGDVISDPSETLGAEGGATDAQKAD